MVSARSAEAGGLKSRVDVLLEFATSKVVELEPQRPRKRRERVGVELQVATPLLADPAEVAPRTIVEELGRQPAEAARGMAVLGKLVG